MSYARHIGRVGALAVALGVGVAVATTPGIASAQPSDSNAASSTDASTTDSSSTSAPTTTSTSTEAPSTGDGTVVSGGATDTNSAGSAPESVPESTSGPSQTIGGDVGRPVVVISSSGGALTAGTDEDEGPDEATPAAGDNETTPEVDPPGASDDDDVSAEASVVPGSSRRAAPPDAPSGGASAAQTQSAIPDETESVAADDEQSTGPHRRPPATVGRVAAEAPAPPPAAAISANALAAASVNAVVPAAPAPSVWDVAGSAVSTVVTVASQLLSAWVSLATAPAGSESPLALMMLAFARREFENLLGMPPAADADSGYYVVDAGGIRPLTVAEAAALAVPADDTAHVLMIGVDGTRLDKILQDDYNQAFFALMNQGTTAAATIVGHTTVSNPSWTSMFTGVFSETAGVINNTFTPWTYDTWPTLWNQLELFNPAINTTSISDWEIIYDIAGAGSTPGADVRLYFPLLPGDDWLATDDQVGAASVAAIQNTPVGAPSFQFTYFVGVDNNGHEHSADSPQYAAALRNVNDNIADIMAAVAAREDCNTGHCENWTVILVTDHGQVGPPTVGGRAHGFQTPQETTTWIIARDKGTVFGDGLINNTYRNVDVTPTVLSLFGAPLKPYFEGSTLQSKAGSDYAPAPGQLHRALLDAIAMYGYPDITTDVALTLRTIVATVPYLIDTANTDVLNALDGAAGIPVVGTFAQVLKVPINIILGGFIYESFNIPAQYIVRLTGVTGNHIIPPDLLSRLTGGLIGGTLADLPAANVPGVATPPCSDESLPAACLAS